MSRWRAFPATVFQRWREQDDQLSMVRPVELLLTTSSVLMSLRVQVEILLRIVSLMCLFVRRCCDAVIDVCFWLVLTARQTSFERSPVPSSSDIPEGRVEATRVSIEQNWDKYFRDTTQWWDNRRSKVNPRAPDFKHKRTRKALWLDSYYTPEWVRARLN